jgi:hypothetical protein
MNREILGKTYWRYMTLPGPRQDHDDRYPLAAIKIAAKTLAAILLLATLSGCALLRSQVAVVHQLPKDLSGTTYVMIPFKEQEGRAAHKVYEEAVRQQAQCEGLPRNNRRSGTDSGVLRLWHRYG